MHLLGVMNGLCEWNHGRQKWLWQIRGLRQGECQKLARDLLWVVEEDEEVVGKMIFLI